MLRSTESFRTVWSESVYPVIQAEYDALVREVPSRLKAKHASKVAKLEKKEKKRSAKGEHEGRSVKGEHEGFAFDTPDQSILRKMETILEDLSATKERRNVYMNLAWTGPVENTRLQENIPYQKVANMAIDLFLDTSKLAVSAPAGNSQDSEGCDAPGLSVLEVAERQEKRPWNIPEKVERGFEIPICITDLNTIPTPGEFKRLGMDVVVNAVWLALSWAIKEANATVVSQLKALILDWPMDFVLIEGSTPEEVEENKFKWAVNMSAAVERLQDFVGLENQNLMRIVAAAAEFSSSKLISGRKAKADLVHKWLVTNVRWGAFNCPDIATVERHLANWVALQRNPKVMELVESANQRWGRSNLLDWPTKLQIIVGKTDANSLTYVVEALYIRVVDRGQPCFPSGTFATSAFQ